MIKVAFWHDRPTEYSGGLNYIRNLLHAISLVNAGRIKPYLFLGATVSTEDAAGFDQLATVVRTPILDRGSAWWFLDRLLVRGLGSQMLVKRELRKYGIQVVSHAEHVAGLGRAFRVISWFPDFQFLHLPEFFPKLDVAKEILRLRSMITQADAIILSSHAAFEDFRSIAPTDSLGRAHVLQFVSQPHVKLKEVQDADTQQMIERQYGIKGRYFFLPNQFWIHKNHWIAFKAVAELKARGCEVLLVCTGNFKDYRIRNNEYMEALTAFLANESLRNNVLILGLVPYEHVLYLMRNCVAVINPSRFEGWSSTVEEAKSIGKRIALSNIPVHREQAPPRALYFDPDDVHALSSILENWWLGPAACSAGAKQDLDADLRNRTLSYGEKYIQLVEKIQEPRQDS